MNFTTVDCWASWCLEVQTIVRAELCGAHEREQMRTLDVQTIVSVFVCSFSCVLCSCVLKMVSILCNVGVLERTPDSWNFQSPPLQRHSIIISWFWNFKPWMLLLYTWQAWTAGPVGKILDGGARKKLHHGGETPTHSTLSVRCV